MIFKFLKFLNILMSDNDFGVNKEPAKAIFDELAQNNINFGDDNIDQLNGDEDSDNNSNDNNIQKIIIHPLIKFFYLINIF